MAGQKRNYCSDEEPTSIKRSRWERPSNIAPGDDGKIPPRPTLSSAFTTRGVLIVTGEEREGSELINPASAQQGSCTAGSPVKKRKRTLEKGLNKAKRPRMVEHSSASDGCDKERRRNEEEQRGQTDRVRLSARHIKVDGLQYRERERYSISKNSKRQKPTGARKENLRRTVKEENQTTEENLLAVAEDNKQERRELFEATTLPGHGTNSPNLQETELVGALPDKIGVAREGKIAGGKRKIAEDHGSPEAKRSRIDNSSRGIPSTSGLAKVKYSTDPRSFTDVDPDLSLTTDLLHPSPSKLTEQLPTGMVNDAKDPEALAAMTLLGTRATSFQKKKEANGPPTGEELNFESLRHHSLRETSSLSPDKVLKLVTTRKEGRSAPSNAGADGLVFPTPIQHQQENSQDMPRLSIRSAADNLLEPSTGAGIKEGNNDDTMDQVLPPEIAFQSPLPKDQSKGSERDWSAPIVAAAHTLSDPPSITFKKDSIGGKGDYSEVLKTAASTPITTSQAPITPPHSLSGDPPDQTCMTGSCFMSTKKNNALSTAGILITPPNSPLTAEEEALAKYYYEMCKHEAIDIDDPAMARKFTTQPPRDLSSNEQNNDEEDDSEDDNEEHNVVFSTCLTWEHSMQVAMAEVAKLGHIKKKCRGISDTEIRIPRNSDAAYYQFEGYSQFKQVAERTLQEYREALDDIRYTRDGTMRKELELEDRSEYYDCVKECEEYNDCYEYDPPMIRPVSCNSYFQELEPPVLLNPPPPPICRNTPVSNTLFDLEDKENQRFKDFYEDDETLNAMTDPEVDKMITGLEDTDEEMAASKTAIMDKMHESQVHYDKIFLEFEKNKRAMGKWSNKDPRWERNMYAEAAMRLASDFIEGTSKTLPKWRSDLTDQGHDKLINDWNGALSHIRMLADRLNMAQTLLKHSIMDDRLRAKVLEDEREKDWKWYKFC